ncbi:MAG: type II toxin-antitoxin system HipA family toxin [Sutterellaceae bacterium]|nr:type II toxin-antitoxin system HipA family toxin [Sutterellaceae bacterium]
MTFFSGNEIRVLRTLSDGQSVVVGTLSKSDNGIAFRYDETYLHTFAAGNLSPLKLAFDDCAQVAALRPHQGLHGVFADSLPDGWGMLLLDRYCKNQGSKLADISRLGLLPFVGNRAVGALSYEGVAFDSSVLEENSQTIDLCELGTAACDIFEDKDSPLLAQLLLGSTVGGACPKALLNFSDDFEECSLVAGSEYSPWIVKFTSSSLSFGHEAGLLEAATLKTAQAAGIAVNDFRLFSGAQGKGRPKMPYWLGVKRFDRTPSGKLHFASAAGLLDADYRIPSLDYEDLIRLTATLTKSQMDTQEMFRRAVFNFLICNCDDHAKNFGFLMDDNGGWHLSPAYDITFSPNVYREHATSFAGCGKTLTAAAVQKLGRLAGLRPKEISEVCSDIVRAVAGFAQADKSVGVRSQTANEVQQVLNAVLTDNATALR